MRKLVRTFLAQACSHVSCASCFLFDHVDRTLQEGIEGGTLQHAVLKQSEVDELMHNLVVLGEGSEDVLLLCALLLKALLSVLDIVFLLLRNLLGLLAALALMQGSKASFQALHLADNRLQLVSTSGVLALHDALDEGVVAVEHNVVSVGHLCVEGHACLVAAHLLHTAYTRSG